MPEGDTYSVDVPECLYSAGRAIAASLTDHPDAALRQVGWAFAWIFSCTGNSLCDLTNESLAELEPLSWSAEDVAFAIELLEEAKQIMADVEAGLTLMSQPKMRRMIQKLITRIKR